jgi:mannose-6-phosphate isomerase-like protein (cupin superfamily)
MRVCRQIAWLGSPLPFKEFDAMPDAINLWNNLATFADCWTPRVIAETAGCQLKLVKLHGEEVWQFPADRIVFVLDGELVLKLRGESVSLSAGEMYVVPRDTVHRPMAPDECSVMLVEPSTGHARSAAPAEVWV